MPEPVPIGEGTLPTGWAWQSAFTFLLLLAMAVATFMGVSFGLLATFLIDDLGITRTQVGFLVSGVTLLAAAASPFAGRVTDAFGSKTAFAGIFAIAAVAFVVLAAAPVYGAMFAAVGVAAIAQAVANPATNKLIAQHLPVGRRGVVTGIKQSGVQAGIFLGGLAVPSAAIALGWRTTVVLVALVPLAALPAVALLIPSDRPQAGMPTGTIGPLPPSIPWLAVYAFLAGFGGAVTIFLPLYVEEALDLGPRLGGIAIGLVGLTAVVGRVGWARAAERRRQFIAPLAWIAAVSVFASAALWAADQVGPALLWIGVVAAGLSSSSWNSVAMLAVVHDAGAQRTGRASGVVMLGFFAGLGSGPPLFGYTVDATGRYDAMWMISIAVFVVTLLWTLAWKRSEAGGNRPQPVA